MSTYSEDNNPICLYTNEATSWELNNGIYIMQFPASPGVVESIQFAEDGRNFNALLHITIDGGETMTCSAPAFFGFSLDPNSGALPIASPDEAFLYNTNIIAGINNKNYVGCSQNHWGCTKRVFIPFTNSITIWVDNNDTAATIYSQVAYRLWPSSFPLYYSIGQRRKYWKVIQYGTWAAPITLQEYYTANVPVISGRGQIEFITHVLWGVTKTNESDTVCNPMSCLEGQYTMTIDGNTQIYGSSDQFWGGQYYWQNGGAIVNGPDCGLFTWMGQPWQGDFNMHAYRFCYDKPLFFNESFQLTWVYGGTLSQFGQGVKNSSNIFLMSYWLESTS